MPKKTPTPHTITDSVDQIRDILFGEQVKIFEAKFIQLEQKLADSVAQLSATINTAIQQLQAQIDKSSHQSSAENILLGKDLNALESRLSDKIIQTEADLSNQLQTGLSQLDAKASHRNELAQLLKNMAEKLAD